MPQTSQERSPAEEVAAIVSDAGGRLVGRTRLQKTAYFLDLAGLGGGFSFGYRHYGPYSEELSAAVRGASLRGAIRETEKPTEWGGFYSIYETKCDGPSSTVDPARRAVIEIAVDADPVALELAATAAFLAREGSPDPWAETERRKPEKAGDGRLERARELYSHLRAVPTPQPLPDLG